METNSPNSTKQWKHWKKTFQNYVAVYETEGVRIDKLQDCKYLRIFCLIRSMSTSMSAKHTTKPLAYLTYLLKLLTKFLRDICLLPQNSNLDKLWIIICKSFEG